MLNPTSIGGGIGSSLNSAPAVNNPKTIRIQAVENGFIVTKQKVDSYGEDSAIATDIAALQTILIKYFN